MVNFLFGLIEFCGPLLTLPIINQWFSNRSHWCTGTFLVVTVVFGINCGITQKASGMGDDSAWHKAVLALQLIGALPAVIVSAFLFAWSTELYPTPIRNSALGVFIFVGKMSGIIISQMFKLNHPPYNLAWIPLLFLAVIALVAAFIRYSFSFFSLGVQKCARMRHHR